MQSDRAYAEFGHEQPPTAPRVETDRSWLVLLHLSQFLGYLVPLAGFVAPILIWLLAKDESEEIDRHGRNVANWIITSTIYWVVVIPFCFVVIGIPFAMLLGVLATVFPIVGAVKSSQGVDWKYPMTIRFF